MSYCRKVECDVYVFTTGSELVCCQCLLGPDLTTTSRADMVRHLEAHVEAGHDVAERAFERLRSEIEQVGDDASGSPIRFGEREAGMILRSLFDEGET